MNRDQTIYFTCPGCDKRFAHVEEPDRDLHTGETYHCSDCGGQVVFQALSMEDYAATDNRRRDCYFCKPDPCRFGPSIKTTQDFHKGDTP